ncbi:hypothetical protein AB0I60_03300 [Actinosynnema sp. NPDC050436]|uniref:hypothetical protein n=1 Tax=Actinosynnema sp. NPDC050436 TaxID=3155659 RepID=UPI0033E27BC6
MDRGTSPEERLAEFRRSSENDAGEDLGVVPEVPGEFRGESADGSVAVTVAAGRVTSVVAARAPGEYPGTELGTHLVTAVNAALAAARAAAPQAADPVPDLGVLLDRITELGEQSSRFTRQLGAALDDVVAKVGPRTGMHGDGSPGGVDALFSDAAAALRTARDSLAGLQGAQVLGTGSDEDGDVWVTVGVDGAVSKAELSAAVGGMTARQFNDRARQAADAALRDWLAKRAEQRPPGAGGVDPARLAAQADALRTQSLEHLRGYTGRLKSIMGSIGEP